MIGKLIKELKSDKDLFYAYQSGIAMAYLDSMNWYKQKTGKKHLNKSDYHKIANDAAEYFLKQLCK